jgi:sensor histidine kinase YesM
LYHNTPKIPHSYAPFKPNCLKPENLNAKPEKINVKTLPRTQFSLNTASNRLALLFDRLSVRRVVGYWLGLALCGVAVVLGTRLQEGIAPQSALYWLCYEYFVVLLWVLWLGNRMIWSLEARLKRRIAIVFFKQYSAQILFLAALLLWTAPVSYLLALGWFGLAEQEIRWESVRSITVWNTLIISILTFFYETTVLAGERKENLLQMEKLNRASIQAELEALKLQLDPHFLFNSLNTLSHLIEVNPAQALAFNDHLAEVYRYVLQHKSAALVRLSEELELLQSYYALLRLRFGDCIELSINTSVQSDDYEIMPLALQLLLENAVKHNELSKEKPLLIELRIDADSVCIENPRRPKRMMKMQKSQMQKHQQVQNSIKTDPGTGLSNLDERSKLTTQQRIVIVESAERFFVKIPIVKKR